MEDINVIHSSEKFKRMAKLNPAVLEIPSAQERYAVYKSTTEKRHSPLY